MKYQLNDKPTNLDMFVSGLQWFTAILPSLIIISGIVSGLHTDDVALKTIFTQKTFAITGIALIVQILIGHRLPVLIGPATILLIGLNSTLNLSLAASYTAMAVGGALTMLLTFGKFFGYIQRLFTTRVIVVTLILVGVTMAPLIISLSSGENNAFFFNIIFSISLALAMIVANTILRGIAKSLVILLGLLVGTGIYFLVFGVPVHQSVASYNWSLLADNLFITPEFNLSAIIAFLFCFLALTVNEFGAIQATGRFVQADNVTDRSKKGLRVSGFFNTLAGMFGVIGVVDYSLSPGIIAATRSASRYPLIVAGVILIVCALFPQSLSIFSYIPSVVMGSVMFYMMSTQIASGMLMMSSEKAVSDFNTAITIGFPVMIGICISFAPQAFKDAIPSLVQPILCNGFIMGIVSVVILEFALNKGK